MYIYFFTKWKIPKLERMPFFLSLCSRCTKHQEFCSGKSQSAARGSESVEHKAVCRNDPARTLLLLL
ncbi:hypothetical protein SKAU_G00247030 [Synaphobranchus kaupii]|uniref:Uncharacterized protein n=1 Tax=Synaphobranchus kaupii TaxID=118154 RepID=A0A9Q1F242_SYNKA|nr:hypothetical protein SKAU_G00247030 [Synaphobranchus kaupii]